MTCGMERIKRSTTHQLNIMTVPAPIAVTVKSALHSVQKKESKEEDKSNKAQMSVRACLLQRSALHIFTLCVQVCAQACLLTTFSSPSDHSSVMQSSICMICRQSSDQRTLADSVRMRAYSLTAFGSAPASGSP